MGMKNKPKAVKHPKLNVKLGKAVGKPVNIPPISYKELVKRTKK